MLSKPTGVLYLMGGDSLNIPRIVLGYVLYKKGFIPQIVLKEDLEPLVFVRFRGVLVPW
jgi:hypothetical protein